ncbi:Alg14-domain-containing protein [Anaeromyces robustus]|uniref:UDP-N-acetylglucosamine transferase subunit ALG14 n=1 Tax=Anaeromyces robustus TaxID=1754192 RepID=A0A1Y1X6B6_9FUNG|nr:Alg14-domain-containing protein [Anaeromyces robustus]|eukprot:ORX81205.1 Alg14-domain-containing protein [Anaeromyces robustus]
MIVFGSGGHTTEMIRLVKNLPRTRYSPRNYVVADTDEMSKEKIQLMEEGSKDSNLIEIPRSRKVHQSYFTSIFTTLNAMFYCFINNYKYQPDLIICNGPGTCIPVCYSALILSWLMPWRKTGFGKIKIVYIESLARVKSLSLTGKLLLPTASLFIIQWPELYTKITGIEINTEKEAEAEKDKEEKEKEINNEKDINTKTKTKSTSKFINKRIIFRDDLM